MNAHEYDLMEVTARDRVEDLRATVEVARADEPPADGNLSRAVHATLVPCRRRPTRLALGEGAAAP